MLVVMMMMMMMVKTMRLLMASEGKDGARGRIPDRWRRRKSLAGGRSRRGGGEGAMVRRCEGKRGGCCVVRIDSVWRGQRRVGSRDEQPLLRGFARLECCSSRKHF